MAKPVLETPKVYTAEQLPKTAVTSQAQSLRDLGTNINVGLNSLLKYAREEADRQGVREGNTALLSDVLTIDPTTGSSKALSGLPLWGNRQMQAYQNVIEERFAKNIGNQVLQYSTELNQKIQFNDNWLGDYQSGMEKYLKERTKHAKDDFYKNKIIDSYEEVVTKTTASIMEEVQTREVAKLSLEWNEEKETEVYDDLLWGLNGGSWNEFGKRVAEGWENNERHRELRIINQFDMGKHEANRALSFYTGRLEHLFNTYNISERDRLNIFQVLADPNKMYLLPSILKRKQANQRGTFELGTGGNIMARPLDLKKEIEEFHSIVDTYNISTQLLNQQLEKLNTRNTDSNVQSNPVIPNKSSMTNEMLMVQLQDEYFIVNNNNEIVGLNPEWVGVQDASQIRLYGTSKDLELSGWATEVSDSGEIVRKDKSKWSAKEKLHYQATQLWQNRTIEAWEKLQRDLGTSESLFNPKNLEWIEEFYNLNSDEGVINFPKVSDPSEMIDVLVGFMEDPRYKNQSFRVPKTYSVKRSKLLRKGSLSEQTNAIKEFISGEEIFKELMRQGKSNRVTNAINSWYDYLNDSADAWAKYKKESIKKSETQRESNNFQVIDNYMKAQRNLFNITPANPENVLQLIEKHELYIDSLIEADPEFYQKVRVQLNGNFSKALDNKLIATILNEIDISHQLPTLDENDQINVETIYNADNTFSKHKALQVIQEILNRGINSEPLNNISPRLKNAVDLFRANFSEIKQDMFSTELNNLAGQIEEDNRKIEEARKEDLFKLSVINQDTLGLTFLNNTITNDNINSWEEAYINSKNRAVESGGFVNSGFELDLLDMKNDNAKILSAIFKAGKMPPSMQASFNAVATGTNTKDAKVLLEIFRFYNHQAVRFEDGSLGGQDFMKNILTKEVYNEWAEIDRRVRLFGDNQLAEIILEREGRNSRAKEKLERAGYLSENVQTRPAMLDAVVQEYFEDADFRAEKSIASLLNRYLAEGDDIKEAVKRTQTYIERVMPRTNGEIWNEFTGDSTTHSGFSLNVLTEDKAERHRLIEEVFLKGVLQNTKGGKVYIDGDGKHFEIVIGDYSSTKYYSKENLDRYNVYSGIIKDGTFEGSGVETEELRLWFMPHVNSSQLYSALTVGEDSKEIDEPLPVAYKKLNQYVEYIVMKKDKNNKIVPFMPKGEMVIVNGVQLNDVLRDIELEKFNNAVEKGSHFTNPVNPFLTGSDTSIQKSFIKANPFFGINEYFFPKNEMK